MATASLADPVVFLVVPFPAQSHLNQLLRLAQLIRLRGFSVHYAATVIHCRQVKLRNNKLADGIIFHELVTPPFSSPPPQSLSSTKFPGHLWPSFEASMNLRDPVAALMRELSMSIRRLVIIHDQLMSYVVQDSPSVMNVESYSFGCASAFCGFCATFQLAGEPYPVELEPEAIPIDSCFIPEMVNFFLIQTGFEHINHGKLFNSCRAIEGPYLDFLVERGPIHKKQWAIAPLFPATKAEDQDHRSAHPCLEWLDTQPSKSVIFVSFGSTTTMSHEQINELALGLEESKQRFLWVLREADKGDIFKDGEPPRILQLPQGFEERVKGVGIVTSDWVPQLGILRHPSIGGFMSHCGWNSCLESLTMGVPLATWPQHSDQPYNALLITNILKVGIPVIGWGERDQLVTSSTIKKVVESLMVSSEGDAVRRRAEGVGEAARKSVEEEDLSELNSFLSYAAK